MRDSEELFSAAAYGSSETIRELISSGLDVNIKSNYGQGSTALHKAIGYNNTAVIETLIELGADVNALDSYGDTALNRAARGNYVEAMKTLIKLGVSVNAADSYGDTALHKAAYDRMEAMETLIKLGADFGIKNIHGTTALHVAASSRQVKGIRRLIEIGANVDSKDNSGKTPLHIAASNRNDIAVETLVKLGADMNAVDRDGNTALHEAVSIADIGCMRALIELGANIDIANNSGKTALISKLSEPYHSTYIISFLILKGATCTPEQISHDVIMEMFIFSPSKIELSKIFEKKFGAMDYNKFLINLSQKEGADLEDLFALKFGYQRSAEQIIKNLIPKLKEFHDVALELNYPEDKILELFGEYIAHPEAAALMSTNSEGASILGIHNDLLPKIIGVGLDVIKIHMAMQDKAIPRGTEKTREKFFAEIDDFAHKYTDISPGHKDKMKDYVNAHIKGKPLSERNHEFFVKLCKAAGHEAHAESDWKALIEHNDHATFAHRIDDLIHEYIKGHSEKFPPDTL
jgi:ankyrin repeat protein